jgi:hypothetical protein
MNDATESLRRELEDAFQNRAHLYRLMLEELEAELGPERAEAVLVRALERRGGEVARGLFAGMPADPVAIGERFLSVSPDGGRMYPHRRDDPAGGFAVQVARCPLKDAWLTSGLPAVRVAQLCRIAGAFDRGLFETAGLGFANRTWREGATGCCHIALTSRNPK